MPVEQILMLTFSRRAAGELRDRVTARLGRTVREPVARTLHSYAFGVLRLANLAQGLPAPRLLSGPEQDVILRELLAGRDPASWPAELRPGAAHPGVRRRAARPADARGRARPRRRRRWPRSAVRSGRPDWVAAGQVPRRVPRRHRRWPAPARTTRPS